jgi:FKBP-type peptidyl-prolyl cis-trans isomerase FkpA
MRSCRRLLAATVVVLCAGLSACDDSSTAPSDFARFSQADVRLGTGAAATIGLDLTVEYTGWLYDGSQTDQKGPQFETSRGREPLAFTLGAGQVIRGWDQGLIGMRVGGLRRLVIPPSLAYGGVRNGPIPPNATLIFEVELLDVEAGQ